MSIIFLNWLLINVTSFYNLIAILLNLKSGIATALLYTRIQISLLLLKYMILSNAYNNDARVKSRLQYSKS